MNASELATVTPTSLLEAAVRVLFWCTLSTEHVSRRACLIARDTVSRT